MKQTLANPDATRRYRRPKGYRHLAVVAALFLASVCSAAPSVPRAAPQSPAIASAASASASVAPQETRNQTYEPVVKLDNETSLKDAAVPFATYLVAMHLRVHPVFAEELSALDNLAQDQALKGDLATTLEIAIDQNTGKPVRMGVNKPSGRTASPRSRRSATRSPSTGRRTSSSRRTATPTCAGSSTAILNTPARRETPSLSCSSRYHEP